MNFVWAPDNIKQKNCSFENEEDLIYVIERSQE